MVWKKSVVLCILATFVQCDFIKNVSDVKEGRNELETIAESRPSEVRLRPERDAKYVYVLTGQGNLQFTSFNVNTAGKEEKLHRQKRRLNSSALRRIIMAKQGRKRGSKKISKKELPALIAKIKAAKRRKKAKERKASNNSDNESSKPEISEIITDAQTKKENTPSSTNEINLTVHVDMNDPETKSKVTDTRNNIVNDINRYPSIQQPRNQNVPFVPSNFPVPSASNNILGINPPFQYPVQANSGQSLNAVPQRRFPATGSGLAPLPVFTNPSANTRIVDNYFKNEMKLSNDANAFPVDERAVVDRIPIRSSSAKYPGGSQQKLLKNQPNSNISQINRKDRMGKDRHSETELDSTNEKRETDLETSEIKGLLKDIKSIVGSLAPLVANNVQSTKPSNNDKFITKKYNNENDEQISKRLRNEENRRHNPLLEETNKSKHESLQKQIEELREIESQIMHKETSNNIETKEFNTNIETPYSSDLKDSTFVRKSPGNKPVTSKPPSTDFNAENQQVGIPSNKPPININTLNNAQNPQKVDKKRLSRLKSDVFLKKLRALEMITDRENAMLQKMSPRWKKKDKINRMFNQLMRRKYFRDNVKKLLDTELTEDFESNSRLILSLMNLKENQ